MITFPNCKINLGLNVISKRDDGFHNIETLFYPLSLKDVLEIIPAKEETTITISGKEVPGQVETNSCIKAYHLLKAYYPAAVTPLSIYLHKTIPAGAGLGGGSANGAFMLTLLNNYFQLKISEENLLQYALQIGSDCPFFIINKPCMASGRGEKLETHSLDLSAYSLLIVNPGIHINTAWAFEKTTPQKPTVSISETLLLPIEKWKEKLTNDFEAAVFQEHSEIGNIKDTLYNAGAIYAALSGTGSTIFGIFKEPVTELPSFPTHYFVKQL